MKEARLGDSETLPWKGVGSPKSPQEHPMKKLMFGISDTGYWIPTGKEDPYPSPLLSSLASQVWPCGRRPVRARRINGEEATSTSVPLWGSEPKPAVVDVDTINQKNVLPDQVA